MSRPLLLDLFCGAGGAAMGYYRAGFDVIGVDIDPQPNYPFEFKRLNALGDGVWHALRLGGFAAIHASPPCQSNLHGLNAVNQALGRVTKYPDLITSTRRMLRAACLPYVIENVVGASLMAPVRMCGSSFGLPIRRHRLFESNVLIMVPDCEHDREGEKKYWTSVVKNGERTRARVVQVYGNGGERHEWGPALGIDWMTPDELTQAIPPVYTEHIGRQLLAHISERAA